MGKKIYQFAFLTCLAATSCGSPETDIFAEHRNADGSLDYVNEEASTEFDWTEPGDMDDLPSNEFRIETNIVAGNFLISGPFLNRTITCQNTHEAAELTYFFASNPPNTTEGGWITRFAASCGEEYVIVQYDDPTPERFFGPFTKKTNAQ